MRRPLTTSIALEEARVATLRQFDSGLGWNRIEVRTIPLFIINGSNLLSVSAKFVLDFVYYKEGMRRIPRSINVGDTIFEGARPFMLWAAAAGGAVSAREVTQAHCGELSDSAEDSESNETSTQDDHTPSRASANSVGEKGKCSRGADQDEQVASSSSVKRLKALHTASVDDPELVSDLDQLILLRQSAPFQGSEFLRDAEASDSKSQFHPSAMQQRVYQDS